MGRGINVLSYFDGCSGGNQALEMSGIKVKNYFACEVDKFAITVTQKNYPNVIQLGDVTKVNLGLLPKIDLFIGGSPCQSFSFAGKRKGMATKDNIEIYTLDHYLTLKEQGFEFEGQSYLFWEYIRALTYLRKINPKVKFLLENVEMGEKWEKVLSKAIGVNGIHINSALLTAQNRKRIYWTNIGMQPSGLFGDLESVISQPKDKGILLKDILEQDVESKYYLSQKALYGLINQTEKHAKKGNGFSFNPTIGGKKGNAITNPGKNRVDDNFIKCAAMRGRNPENPKSRVSGLPTQQQIEPRSDDKTNCLTSVQKDNLVLGDYSIRRLTPIECERLQGMKDNYTQGVSDSQRYKMIGNGWTIPVISHIFNYYKNENN